MKITYAISAFYPRWGGAENQVLRQATALAQRGHVVQVLTWRHEANWPACEVLAGVTVRRVNRYPGLAGRLRSFLEMVSALATACRESDVLSVHHLLSVAYMGAAIGALTGTRVVAKAAGPISLRDADLAPLAGDGLRAHLLRLLALPLRRHATMVAISREIEEDCRRLGFQHIVSIPNGVVDTGIPNRTNLRQELYVPLGIAMEQQVVAASGRFVDRKGFSTLLAAWQGVQHSGATLLLIGDGPERSQLERQAATLQGVIFLPPSPRASEYLAAADVVVLPSYAEGMSNVLLEAMIAAVPVISSRISGSVDLIEDGVSGRLVTPGDAAELAGALHDVLQHPGDMGRRGRERVLSRAGMEIVLDRYEALFRALPPKSGR